MLNMALTIAGSDSGGGAGIQADLKTFSALGVYGMSVITSVTAQNTTGVIAIEDISPDVVAKQLEAIFDDFQVDAVKIGMVSNSDITQVIADYLKQWGGTDIVLDPVMVSTSGSPLLKKEARETLIRDLFPLVCLITPNLYEAEMLINEKIESIKGMEIATKRLYELGADGVLIKGGHLNELKSNYKGLMEQEVIDIYYDGNELYQFKAPRINTRNTHGTGCTYSSAIASYLAKGYDMVATIKKAKKYITGAIKHSLNIGHGPGPTNHFYKIWE